MTGTKHDAGKPRWSLMPWDALTEVLRVLEHGAEKYAPDNWRHVEPVERYWDAAMRHLVAWQQGRRIDEESGLPTLAHAACCVLFLLAREDEVESATSVTCAVDRFRSC